MAIYRIPVKITHASLPDMAMNVLHFRVSAGVNTESQNLGEAITTTVALYNAIKNYYAYQAVITIGESMIRDPLGTPEYVDDDVHTLSADGVAGNAPVLLAACVGWRTSSATRSGRGRTFFGPLSPAVLESNGTPTTNFVGDMNTAVNAFVASSQEQNEWAFGVLSTKTGVFRDVTGHSLKDRWAYLSSRRD